MIIILVADMQTKSLQCKLTHEDKCFHFSSKSGKHLVNCMCNGNPFALASFLFKSMRVSITLLIGLSQEAIEY